jgi:hypothetical protein
MIDAALLDDRLDLVGGDLEGHGGLEEAVQLAAGVRHRVVAAAVGIDLALATHARHLAAAGGGERADGEDRHESRRCTHSRLLL